MSATTLKARIDSLASDPERPVIVLNRDLVEVLGYVSSAYALKLVKTDKWFMRGTASRCQKIISRRQIDPAKFKPEFQVTRPQCRNAHPDWLASSAAGAVSRHAATHAALLESAAGSHTNEDWAQIVARYGNKCLRCEATGAVVLLTKDHVVPLSQNGTDYASNLQPLCGPCNSWKGSREIDFRGTMAYASFGVSTI